MPQQDRALNGETSDPQDKISSLLLGFWESRNVPHQKAYPFTNSEALGRGEGASGRYWIRKLNV